jgi:hypothetical protein
MVSNRVTFTAGVAVNRDMFYIVTVPDDLQKSEYDAYSRMVFYQGQTKDKWFHHDLPNWRVQSVCFPDVQPDQVRVVYSLSEDGGIEKYSRNGSVIEQISDAGLSSGTPGYGYVNRIRHIGGELYVCGYNGQIYKQTEVGWSHVQSGLLQKPAITAEQAISSIENALSLTDINGFNSTDIYTIGNGGFVAHYNGTTWKKLAITTDEDLNCIYCDDRGVVIVGFNGTVLTGDAKQGFVDLSSIEDNNYFYSVTKYQGLIYLGANDGLFVMDKKISLVPESKKFKLDEVQHVEAKDGVLWVLARKSLVRFDGTNWECFKHPDNK